MTTTAVVFLAGGLLALLGALDPAPGQDAVVTLVTGALSVAVSPLLFVWGRVLPQWMIHLFIPAGSAALAAIVLTSGGGARAVGTAAFVLLTVIPAGLHFPLRPAVAHWLTASVLVVGSVLVADPSLVAESVFLLTTMGLSGFMTTGVVRTALTAEVDPLTGLVNRRGCERVVADALAAARRRPLVVTLVLLDLDGFKAVNDLQGHQAGDALLVRLADALRTAAERRTAVARIGGDEFALLLRHDDVAGAEAEVQRVEAAVRDVCSASVGVAHHRAQDTLDTLHARADAAMYAVKRTRAARPGLDRRAGALPPVGDQAPPARVAG